MQQTVVTITGPTCAGKSTLAKRLIQNGGFGRVISHTSRPPRSDEADGGAYHFVSHARFMEMVADGAFVEHVELEGCLYGTSREAFEACFREGRVAVSVCDPQGRARIAAFGQTQGWRVVAVWLDNPDEVIARRFVTRLLADTGAGHLSQEVGLGYATRLAGMLGREQGWRREAAQPGIYDLCFGCFDAETEETVLREVAEACHLMP